MIEVKTKKKKNIIRKKIVRQLLRKPVEFLYDLTADDT